MAPSIRRFSIALLLALLLAPGAHGAVVVGGVSLEIHPALVAAQEAWIADASRKLAAFETDCDCPAEIAELRVLAETLPVANAKRADHTEVVRLLSTFDALERHSRLKAGLIEAGEADNTSRAVEVYVNETDLEAADASLRLEALRDGLRNRTIGSVRTLPALELTLLAASDLYQADILLAIHVDARFGILSSRSPQEPQFRLLVQSVTGTTAFLDAAETLLNLSRAADASGAAADPARVRAAAERFAAGFRNTTVVGAGETAEFLSRFRGLEAAGRGELLLAVAAFALYGEFNKINALQKLDGQGAADRLGVEGVVRRNLTRLSNLTLLENAGYDGSLLADIYVDVARRMEPLLVDERVLFRSRGLLERAHLLESFLVEAAALRQSQIDLVPLAAAALLGGAVAALVLARDRVRGNR